MGWWRINIGNRKTAQENAEEVTNYDANALNQYTAVGEFVPKFDADGKAADGCKADWTHAQRAPRRGEGAMGRARINQTRVQTSSGIWNVTYNAENRPTVFSRENANGSATRVTCAYDYMGRRATKKVETITTNADTEESTASTTLNQRYLYRGYLQVACCDLTRSAHPCLWLITWDPSQPVATRPLAIQKDGTWYTYGWDLTKNICEVYGQHGYIRTNYSYTPYGDVTILGDVSQSAQWSSEHYDNELGLIYYNYRYYNAKSGNWIYRDSLEHISKYEDGVTTVELAVDRMNGIGMEYNYALNNPTSFIDSLGLENSSIDTDDAGRKCCSKEIEIVELRVRSMLREFPGHCFIKTSKSIRGFYPASKPKAPFWFTGKVDDDSKTSYNVQNTYTYRACPESVRVLEESMNKSEENPPTYNLGNLGGFNCCGWACSMMDSAGFVAPFPAKTPGLAPAPYYGKEYAPNRRPKKQNRI